MVNIYDDYHPPLPDDKALMEQAMSDIDLNEEELNALPDTIRTKVEFVLKLDSDLEQRAARLQKERTLLRRRTQEFNDKLAELDAKFLEVNEKQIELEQKAARFEVEAREQLGVKSNQYVQETLLNLEESQKKFLSYSRGWSYFGAFSLFSASLSFVVITYSSLLELISSRETWMYITYLSFRGLLAISLLIALSKYSYSLSKSYMAQSLKNADRCHAIRFGGMYLSSYGANADWSQVKEAFDNWNISDQSSSPKSQELPNTDASSLALATLITDFMKSKLEKR